MEEAAEQKASIIQRLKNNLEKCILGKSKEIELLLTALLAGGHVLLEDVPGTGKTILVKALAKSIDGKFRRIQCNPDLLPTDITGVSIYHPREETFIFRPGPVMANILLADEINRATTKTQSALLEAMEERHITVDGESYPLPNPFVLMATQNPIEFDGTYELPEAQLDRFMIKFSLGYPDEDIEKQMIFAQSKEHPLDSLQAITNVGYILQMQQEVRGLHIDPSVVEYAVIICRRTRTHPSLFLGASPRAVIALVQASKAYAFISGRNYVIPDDVKFLAPYILGHRMILQSQARMEGLTMESVLQAIFQQVRVPIKIGERSS